MATKCGRCGVQTDIPESFFKERKSFRRTIRTLCPVCHSKSRLSYLKWILVANLIIGASGLICRWLLPSNGIGWYFLNLFFFEIFLIVTILPHELGHAFAARFLGFRVFKIFVGFGKTIFTKRLFGFETEFRPIPLGGLTRMLPRDKNWFRLKSFLCVFAGPLVNLLLCLAVLAIFPSIGFRPFDNLMHGIVLGQVFLYANAYVLVVNLWPRKFKTPTGELSSDGLLLCKTLFLKREAIDKNHAAWFLLESLELRHRSKPEEALVWVKDGLKLYPDNIHLQNVHGVLLIELKEYEKARERFLKLLEQTDIAPPMRALFQNNVAYVDVLTGKADLLAEAEEQSRKALASLGWHPAIKGTRGTVMVELGNLDEAMPLLREAMAQHEEPASKAENACFISIAEARRGNLTASERFLNEAKKLMPSCFLLERATNEFQIAFAKQKL